MGGGLDGHLLSSAFVERTSRSSTDAAGLAVLRRDLAAWSRRLSGFGPASTPRVLLQTGAAPLFDALGFDAPSDVTVTDGALAATLRARGRSNARPVALLVTVWSAPFDPLWRPAVIQAAQRGARWCVLFDGLRLRIVDAGRLWARRHLEFDLELTIEDAIGVHTLERAASANALGAPAGDPLSLDVLVEQSDQEAAGICTSLRDGVLSASRDVLEALIVRDRRGPAAADRRVDVHESFEQALTIVYRLLFLLFAEARALVPLWHPIYRESYSIESLRDAAERPARARGLWDALRAIARLAHTGCRAGDLRVTPFNGRLFAPARTPLAERRGLDDEAARRAVIAISTRPAPDRAGRERIAYRDLGVEQLGAVYETLLDYEPRVERRLVTLAPGSGVRKATGTFYTPQPIAGYLVRRTLAPLVHDATPDRILALRIVDPAMGSGAFLVAACRFLAHAYEAALLRDGGARASDIDEVERASIRRLVAERCLYGVDLNPMAVQLARLSLWLTTLAADRPLSFLDHRLLVGDSLLGAWMANLRRPPSRRRDRIHELPLFTSDDVNHALREALPIRFSLETIPNDTIEQVRAKERALASMTAPSSALSRWKRVANLWCAAWFAGRDAADPSAFGALSDAILTGRGALAPATTSRFVDAAETIAARQRLFHWELEFPEVFFDARGARAPDAGFDAVVGNPPWDMIRADAGTPESRSRARVDTAAVVRFTRDAGIYRAQSDGHANRYQLFVERAIALTKSGGRLGLVLPSGLVTDHGSAPLRRLLLSRCDVDAIVGLDNRRGVFPIHRSVRFVLVTASQGMATRRIACRLGVDDPAELESVGEEAADASPWFPIHLTPDSIARLSGADLAIPHLRTPLDLHIAERAVTLFPPLGSVEGWAVRFGRELNASDDRDLFRPPGRGLPIVEGKHLEPFRVALDSARHAIGAADARRRLRSNRHEQARLAYRDVASATNRVTLIAAVLPPRCVSTHTVFCLRTPMPLHAQHLLCALFNSLVVNYLVRLRVTTHVTTGIVEGLPMPTPASAPSTMRALGALGRLLARRFDAHAFAELNARVAELYQLTRDEFEHVLASFPLIPQADRHGALECFDEKTRR